MNQVELSKELGVSKAYISMVLSGKKKPSKRVAERLTELVNSEDFQSYLAILSPSRLPVPPPRLKGSTNSVAVRLISVNEFRVKKIRCSPLDYLKSIYDMLFIYL